MAGFFDFLATIFKPKDKKDTSVVVKNYITGNNNQSNNTNTSHTNKANNGTKISKTSGSVSHASQQSVTLQSIRLYSTGAKGKVFTDRFYKSVNHNFGIEVVLKNTSSQFQAVKLGHCIYDEKGNTMIKGNFHPKIAPNSTLTEDIYVKADTFARLKNGKYKSQFWINDKKVQKVFFTVTNK